MASLETNKTGYRSLLNPSLESKILMKLEKKDKNDPDYPSAIPNNEAVFGTGIDKGSDVMNNENVLNELFTVKNSLLNSLKSIDASIEAIMAQKLKKPVEQSLALPESIATTSLLLNNDSPNKNHDQSSSQNNNSLQRSQQKALRGKVFQARESTLSELLTSTKDISTIYNIFIAILLLMFASVVSQTYFESSGSSIVDFSLFEYAFAKPEKMVRVWSVLIIYSASGYVWKYVIMGFVYWYERASISASKSILNSQRPISPSAVKSSDSSFTPGSPTSKLRRRNQQNPSAQSKNLDILEENEVSLKKIDRLFALQQAIVISLYSVVQIFMLGVAGYGVLKYDLPPASGLIVMAEAVRISMKVHSFFRYCFDVLLHVGGVSVNTVNKQPQTPVLDGTPEISIDTKNAPKFSKKTTFKHYLYFMFAPTLLYRTSYPRSNSIRWSFVASRAVEFGLILVFMYVMMVRFAMPQLKHLAQSPDSLKAFVGATFNLMIPGMTVFILGFFALLHTWLNLTGELLQFADRQFYRDWWSAHSFAEYYRKWNGVVHDWLYAYVYVDSVRFFEKLGISKSRARNFAALVVIEVSALFHEYIIACAMGHFFPVLMFMFGGPGLVFIFMNPQSKHKAHHHNVFLWANLMIGNGLLMALYGREWFMRPNWAGLLTDGTAELNSAYWRQFFTFYSFK